MQRLPAPADPAQDNMRHFDPWLTTASDGHLPLLWQLRKPLKQAGLPLRATRARWHAAEAVSSYAATARLPLRPFLTECVYIRGFILHASLH
jgi:hypothetical protein